MAGAFIRSPTPRVLTPYAMAIRPMMVMPSQYAEKLPATKPERMLSDAPPSREEVTTSRTCRDSVEVKTFTSSGMMAPASVPQLITVESCHHRSELPPRLGTIMYESTYVSAIEISDVIQTSWVRGVSKLNRAPPL